MQHQKRITPSDLPDEWRTLAAQQRLLGGDAQARTLEYCADELTAAFHGAGEEHLSLRRAAQESGYSADHLGRMIREGRIPNSGRKAKPMIRRKDLPMKASRTKTAPCPKSRRSYDSGRLIWDIIQSKYGDDDAED